MLKIDGSFGEGGGQILRTSLSLSLVTGKPFCVDNIRAGRRKPGLLRQHLASLNAAAEISDAEVDGDIIGSSEVTFEPGTMKSGIYRFATGTAGSATLVLQTVLPALVTAKGRSNLVMEGGTHNPFAPTFNFISKAYLPIINRMGPEATARIERPGFYPAGGGRFTVSIKQAEKLSRVELMSRGKIIDKKATASISKLPKHIAERELETVGEALSIPDKRLVLKMSGKSHGPGNAINIKIRSENITEVFSGFGQRGVRAEIVAERAAEAALEYIESGVPVGKYLADQLLVPMALAGGGKFRTLPPTEHTVTNAEVIKQFLDVDITMTEVEENIFEIEIKT